MRRREITIGTEYHVKLGHYASEFTITVDRIEPRPAWFRETTRHLDAPWTDRPGSPRWVAAFGTAQVGKLPDAFVVFGHNAEGKGYVVAPRYVQCTAASRSTADERAAAFTAAARLRREAAWDEYDWYVGRITALLGVAPNDPTFPNYGDRTNNDPPATVAFHAEALLGALTYPEVIDASTTTKHGGH